MKKLHFILVLALSFVMLQSQTGCNATEPESTSGAKKMTVKVDLDPSGHTAEQENIAGRIKQDNMPGSIKYLYVISEFTGDVLIYSTVKGKVTSSHKRLSPEEIDNWNSNSYGFRVDFPNTTGYTNEILDDNGVYGGSADYIYWFDAKGTFHQHFCGAAIIHISSQPLAVKKAILNMEESHDEQIHLK